MKRLIDIIGSLFLLILLSPILLIISLMIVILDGRPILFKQYRLGINGTSFNIYKFRTMTKGDHSKDKFSINQRITKTGGLLRKLSLDELPQLFNILKGDMSIIGPRPALTDHYGKYSENQLKRLEMKPGVTGLAQVNGRQNIKWSKRIEYDIQYVENFSIWLDMKILLKTVKVVVFGDGVNNKQQVGSQEDFTKDG